jgi:hypothetical protein
MNGPRTRVIVDRPFDRALWLLVEAFLAEGCVLKPVDISTPFRRTGRRRNVLLKVTCPDALSKRLRLNRDVAVLIALDDVADAQTVVTSTSVTSWSQPHPALAAVADALESRVQRALGIVSYPGVSRVAAA